MSEEIDVLDEQMNKIAQVDKKFAHTSANLLHQTFALLRFNPVKKVVCFQTIYPKESYGFSRPDFLDFTIGGHISANESIVSGGIREIKEEIGLDIKPQDLHYCFTRRINKQINNYYINEFQHIFINEYFSESELYNKARMDSEVKSFIEISFDSFLRLLQNHYISIDAQEYIVAENIVKAKDIKLTIDRFIQDYLNEGLLLTMLYTLNAK